MGERLAGKVAIVTGATRGIGRAIAEQFGKEGARVWLTGRRTELGHAVADEIGGHFIRADAGSETDASMVIDTVLNLAGRVDILVNNAGSSAPTGGIADTDLAEFDHMMTVHVRGPLAHMRAAIPAMASQGSGTIINLASVAGHRTGMTNHSYYSIAKAAVLRMTRCAAMELADRVHSCELRFARRDRDRDLLSRRRPGRAGETLKSPQQGSDRKTGRVLSCLLRAGMGAADCSASPNCPHGATLGLHHRTELASIATPS